MRANRAVVRCPAIAMTALLAAIAGAGGAARADLISPDAGAPAAPDAGVPAAPDAGAEGAAGDAGAAADAGASADAGPPATLEELGIEVHESTDELASAVPVRLSLDVGPMWVASDGVAPGPSWETEVPEESIGACPYADWEVGLVGSSEPPLVLETQEDARDWTDVNECVEADVPLSDWLLEGFCDDWRNYIFECPVCRLRSGCPAPDPCTDGVDNDGDSPIDCDDLDCAAEPVCTGGETICDDGLDDDGDTTVDCDDADCAGDDACAVADVETICDDGLDDDGDWFLDCGDPDCGSAPACGTPPDPGDGDCDGVTPDGQCDGSVLSYCRADGPIVLDCAELGMICVDGGASGGGADCDWPYDDPPADGCGDVTHAGSCTGDVLEWCSDGEVKTVDCSLFGGSCDLESPDTGYNCLAPPGSDAGVDGGAPGDPSDAGSVGAADAGGGSTPGALDAGATSG